MFAAKSSDAIERKIERIRSKLVENQQEHDRAVTALESLKGERAGLWVSAELEHEDNATELARVQARITSAERQVDRARSVAGELRKRLVEAEAELRGAQQREAPDVARKLAREHDEARVEVISRLEGVMSLLRRVEILEAEAEGLFLQYRARTDANVFGATALLGQLSPILHALNAQSAQIEALRAARAKGEQALAAEHARLDALEAESPGVEYARPEVRWRSGWLGPAVEDGKVTRQ